MKCPLFHITCLFFQSFSTGAYSLKESKFVIDPTTKSFLLDGHPFRYVRSGHYCNNKYSISCILKSPSTFSTPCSGSVHYFRIHPAYWQDRLLKLRAGGFNAGFGHNSTQSKFTSNGVFMRKPLGIMTLMKTEMLWDLLRLLKNVAFWSF